MAKKKAKKSPKTNGIGDGNAGVGTTVPMEIGEALHRLAASQKPPMSRTDYIRTILMQAAEEGWGIKTIVTRSDKPFDGSLSKPEDSAA